MPRTFSSIFWITLLLPLHTHAGAIENAIEYQRTADGKVNTDLEQLSEAITLGNLDVLGNYLNKGGKIDRAWIEAPGAVSLNMWQRSLWAG